MGKLLNFALVASDGHEIVAEGYLFGDAAATFMFLVQQCEFRGMASLQGSEWAGSVVLAEQAAVSSMCGHNSSSPDCNKSYNMLFL